MKRSYGDSDSLIAPSEITPRDVFERRRALIRAAAAGTFGAALAPLFSRQALAAVASPNSGGTKLEAKTNPEYGLVDKPTPYKDVTTYNNFYEFGTDKGDPAKHAGTLVTRPWTVAVEGLVNKPKVFDIDELMKMAALEERIYRLRCVEGWSMVIPWIGFPLSELIRRVEPQGSAKYVEFITLADKKQMPGLAMPVLEWPYVEGLRMDEAMHALTLLTFGLYGEVLPKQNGAPVRIVTPWKYGFKSPKSIVRIRFTETEPKTSWHVAAPQEYGFYSNVNPAVDHPRWSQASEQRIGEGGGVLFPPKRKTMPFNGYASQVASLYTGMDLKKFF
ncbi:protein-methionine-sulfoxide reductase catalytic subunit MsrP [Propionivibrio soli]|uniref:protein-methionine-sulfoxide reductase catalytic subunit MsrP n=1 Tax=Propionivibrio soli TaxID=2976531 RepID=UPI0021E9A27D|nr:protein-methionine-sulfoxide reductase catalytic subunit MsrP [Propionivibrio soli]